MLGKRRGVGRGRRMLDVGRKVAKKLMGAVACPDFGMF
jgi:hypothetical protein